MSGSPEQDESWVDVWPVAVLVLAVLFGVGLFAGFRYLRSGVREGLQRADCIELTEALRRWAEAGSPQGQHLREFMAGRRPDLIFSNRSFTIQGTNFVSQFAVTKPKSKREGTLFITTNELLIWLNESGHAEVVPFK